MHVKLFIYVHVVQANNVLGIEHLQFHQREMLRKEVPMIKFNVAKGDKNQTNNNNNNNAALYIRCTE